MKIRTIIIDDEPLARERIRSLLLHEPDLEILAECADGPSAVAAIKEHSPDLIFLDGDHQYEMISEDIANAQRLVREGGIICGDDLDIQLHDVARSTHDDALGSGSPYIGAGYHVGVTEAVGRAFGPIVADRFWAVRKTQQGWVSVL